MRSYQLIFGLPFLLVGLAIWGRSIWTGVLALLAGLGAAGARGGDETPVNPEMMVTCYSEEVMPSYLLEDARWASSQPLNDWASAERQILYYAGTDEGDYDRMQALINFAQTAAATAKSEVAAGMLSKQCYELAVSALAEWHADMAISYSSVRCYRRAVPPPAIEDASKRLFSLGKLQMEGKLSVVAVQQAREGMQAVLDDTYSGEVAKETSAFLMDLLGFRG